MKLKFDLWTDNHWCLMEAFVYLAVAQWDFPTPADVMAALREELT